LVLVWIALAVCSWTALAGIGYAAYRVLLILSHHSRELQLTVAIAAVCVVAWICVIVWPEREP